MKKKCSSVGLIVAVLKQADLGSPVADLIPQVGISEQNFYRLIRPVPKAFAMASMAALITRRLRSRDGKS